MTNKEKVLHAMKLFGKNTAKNLQDNASAMTGTQLYEDEIFIPDFEPTKQYLNFSAGYVCKSPSGRICKLVQPYDSTIYTSAPEELPAQWGFKWSQNPDKALPFISLSTSPYSTGECCTENGIVYRSKYDNNVQAPSAWPDGWEKV